MTVETLYICNKTVTVVQDMGTLENFVLFSSKQEQWKYREHLFAGC
jgi:hypothetical protein